MNFRLYINRVFRYLLHGIPIKYVYPNIVRLAPNELLKSRTALITGGTSGIGYAIAEAFLNSGANVIITGRNEDRLKSATEKLRNSIYETNRVYYLLMDNTDVSSFKNKLNEIRDLIGGIDIDILVNNAGVLGGDIRNSSEEEYNLILDTNLKGVFFLSQLFGHYWKEKSIKGNILNIASSSSLRPAASAYTITKWGIRGLTLGLAKSFISHGIVVNGLAPGPTATPMILKDENNGIGSETVPLGRLATAEEIANMAVVLVSGIGQTIVGDIVYMTGGSGTITLDDVNYVF